MLEHARNKVYQDFSGGLNDRLSPILIKENQVSVIENAVVNNRGLLEKAFGFLKDGSPFPNSTDSFIRLLLNYKRGSSVDVLLMAAQDNNNANASYKVDLKQTAGDGNYSYIGHTTGTADFNNGSTAVVGHGTTWLSKLKSGDKIKITSDADSKYVEILSVNTDTSITLTSVYTGTTGATVAYIARVILNKDFIPRGTIFNNKAVITNGSETPETYDSTTVDLITDVDTPKARYITTHKQRVFMANTSGFPSRLFWSHVNDEQTWEADSEEDIFPEDNGNIVSIVSFGDSLVIFKNSGSTNSIYQVNGNFDQDEVGEPYNIRRIDGTENIGIIAERSPIVCNGLLYFLAETGLYSIDQRMGVSKVTFNIENFIKSLNFTLSPSSSKSYNYDTQSQFNTGTLSGTRTTSAGNGTIEPYFDQITISNALKKNGACSVGIGSDNKCYVAHIDSTNSKRILLKIYQTNGTITTETAFTDLINIDRLSLAVSSDQSVGICWSQSPNLQNGSFVQRTVVGTASFTNGSTAVTGIGTNWSTSLKANDRIKVATDSDSFFTTVSSVTNNNALILSAPYGGTTTVSLEYIAWGDREYLGGPGTENTQECALRFTAGQLARAFVAEDSGTGSTRVVVYRRSAGGSWGTGNTFSTFPGGNLFKLDLYIDSSGNLYMIRMQNNTEIGFIKSVDDGDNPTSSDTFSFSALPNISRPQVYANSSNQGITVFGSGGLVKKRNHATTTTTTLNSTTDLSFGQAITSDKEYWTQVDSGFTEKFFFEDSLSITNPSTGTVDSSFYPGRAMDDNGKVYAFIFWGVNANEIILRRISPRSTWTSPETSDSSLTSWGTFNVGNPITAGNTITYEIALNTITPATVFNAITPGAVVSTNPTKIFVKARITFLLQAWASPSVDSITLNYTGAGVDSRQTVGTSFLNELYFAGSTTGATKNNKTLVLDKFGSFLVQDFSVSCFERFKEKLYAGDSSKGDLLILQQGYNYGGSAYPLDAQFKEDFLDSIELEKEVYKIFILYEVKPSGTFTFSYRLDAFKNPNGATWTNTVIDQTMSGDMGFSEILVGQKARSIQSRIQSSDLDAQVGLIAFVIVYAPLHIR